MQAMFGAMESIIVCNSEKTVTVAIFVQEGPKNTHLLPVSEKKLF